MNRVFPRSVLLGSFEPVYSSRISCSILAREKQFNRINIGEPLLRQCLQMALQKCGGAKQQIHFFSLPNFADNSSWGFFSIAQAPTELIQSTHLLSGAGRFHAIASPVWLAAESTAKGTAWISA